MEVAITTGVVVIPCRTQGNEILLFPAGKETQLFKYYNLFRYKIKVRN